MMLCSLVLIISGGLLGNVPSRVLLEVRMLLLGFALLKYIGHTCYVSWYFVLACTCRRFRCGWCLMC